MAHPRGPTSDRENSEPRASETTQPTLHPGVFLVFENNF